MKPFVTEYKSSPRRPKDAFDTSQPSFGPTEAPFDSGGFGSRGTGAPPEDSYEAAMRAADALFSAPKRKPATAPETEAVAPPTPPEAPEPADEPLLAAKVATPGVGRILQAIDAPAADPFAALEAQHAPKRRGRKPGSKNKPKLPLAAIEEPAPRAKPRPIPRHEPKTTAAVPAILAVPAVPVTRPRTIERFAWVRTTLRPGEKWKRRIPKVAW